VAAGLQPDLDTALAQAVRFDRTYTPEPEGLARMETLHALYRPAYEAAREVNQALAALP
jgi:hypothetical protein